jgi:uncharacterized membrane protein YkvA (DUF1232 family)
MLEWLGIGGLAVLVLYAGFVALLAVSGRRGEARAMARFVPDCAVLCGRLARDRTLPRRDRFLLAGIVVYLAMPIDLVPDVIPVAGQLDDAVVVAVGLRRVLRSAGPDRIRSHWPGPAEGLDLVLRLAGPAPRPS